MDTVPYLFCSDVARLLMKFTTADFCGHYIDFFAKVCHQRSQTWMLAFRNRAHLTMKEMSAHECTAYIKAISVFAKYIQDVHRYDYRIIEMIKMIIKEYLRIASVRKDIASL
uniref:Cullin domain-containing protein n=1 Tax=Steinernema glaseri TaxID=37863 RepID=A0A1I8AP81_9BILA